MWLTWVNQRQLMTISQSAKNKQEACSLVQNESINSSTAWMAACYFTKSWVKDVFYQAVLESWEISTWMLGLDDVV